VSHNAKIGRSVVRGFVRGWIDDWSLYRYILVRDRHRHFYVDEVVFSRGKISKDRFTQILAIPAAVIISTLELSVLF
jgi:hypothetical protein